MKIDADETEFLLKINFIYFATGWCWKNKKNMMAINNSLQ